jgi:hypothetical protein
LGEAEVASVVSTASLMKDEQLLPAKEARSTEILQGLLAKCAELRCEYKPGERAEDKENTSALARFLQATYEQLVRFVCNDLSATNGLCTTI